MLKDPHRLETYRYDLPEELIAKTPASPRHSSRLMRLDRQTGVISHHVFSDLPSLLRPGDLLIANNTCVIPARLRGVRLVPRSDGEYDRGGKIEFLLLEEKALLRWEGMFHAAAKHRPGVEFEIPTPDGRGLRGKLVRGASDSPQGTVEAVFDRDPVESGAGEVPLPPYIKRKAESSDLETYQTVYAKFAGSSAAPTAGLHFTPEVFAGLRSRGIEWDEITLHVGLGTFRPVKAADIREHEMHEERYEIRPETAERVNRARADGRRIVAVGTTTVRTLESAFSEGAIRAGRGKTSLFIYPGNHEFQLVDAMVTNFHLPESTLLMMICAFAGTEHVLAAYEEAVRQRYRFFSYGDAMLVE